MIFNHGCLIGSLMFKKGNWVIENEKELDMVVIHLHN
jgi:hypothetical protein